MLTVPKSEVEIVNSLKLSYCMQGNGQFATDSQGRLWTSDGGPRTGMFHQTWPTVANTTCNVKGVLFVNEGLIKIPYVKVCTHRQH